MTTFIGAGQSPQIGDLRTNSSGEIEVYSYNGWEKQNPFMGAIASAAPGSLTGAIGSSAHNQLSVAGAVGATGSIPHHGMATISSVSTGTISAGSRNLTLQTSKGDVTLNLETGDLQLPVGIGREEGIRDFWLAFFEYFPAGNKKEYEDEIWLLKNKMQQMKDEYTYAMKEATKSSSTGIVSKIKKKYGNEKFIMIKPDDLIAFIQDV